MPIQPVILAGGSGSRLWPLSREMYPKQLLRLIGAHSLLQTTVLRAAKLPDVLPPVVMVGEEHRFSTQAQIEELEILKEYPLLLEPVGRDTGPAVCAAALFCADIKNMNDKETLLLVLPADHLIRDEAAFQRAVARAAELAAAGYLVTFGIKPDYPETGFGYIEQGPDGKVASFREKPDRATAESYLQKGNYLWNAGIFLFSIATLREEMEKYAPEILAAMRAALASGAAGHMGDASVFHLGGEGMRLVAPISLDYAVMEKTARAMVVPAELGWSDIGSWQALWRVLDKDAGGNVLQGDVWLDDSENCLVRAESRFVAVAGLRDMVVVETADSLLVASMAQSQKVKEIVNFLKREKRKESLTHVTVRRPWGSYTILEEQPRFQIKRITVKPRAKLSLQLHYHRYEHWVVVRGTAKVTNGDNVLLLRENESTYIPAGQRHRLENPGSIDLEIIEVQIGPYLGEDDIVRFDDEYGRENG